MKEYNVKVTRDVLLYLDADGWQHVPDIKLELNETLCVEGVSENRAMLLLSKNGALFSLPTGLFPEFDIESFEEELRNWKIERDLEEKRQRFIKSHDWDSLRIDISVKLLQSLVSNHARLMDEINTPEELALQHRTARRCIYTAVVYADELINELINGKR